MLAYGPNKVELLNCTINNIDATNYIKGIKVFETMCKSYITAEIYIDDTDTSQFVNGLHLGNGGREPVRFSFWAGDKVYSQLQYVMECEGVQGENIRSTSYTINTVGINYFADLGSIVQAAHSLIPSTEAARMIHNKYLGKDVAGPVIKAAGALIANQENANQTNGVKPIKAIEDILERIAFSGIPTGTPMYFRDADTYQMGPLQAFFMQMTSQQEFWQKNTWGGDWRSVMGGGSPPATHAILRATTIKKGATASAMGSSISTNMFNIQKLLEIGKVAAAMGGGSKDGVQQFDELRNAPSTVQGMNEAIAKAYQARVKSAVNYHIKVPFQSGVYVTVGNGAKINLIQPLETSAHTVDGVGLVADVMHEVYFDNRIDQGTTTFRWVEKTV